MLKFQHILRTKKYRKNKISNYAVLVILIALLITKTILINIFTLGNKTWEGSSIFELDTPQL